MIKAVVFDLDDTLISEKEYIKSGFDVICKVISDDYKIEYDKARNLMDKLFTESSKNVFNRILESYNLKYDNDYIINLINIYRNHIPKINLFDDVEETLEYLKSKNIKLGIITDGYAITQRNKLKVLGIENKFDCVVVTDELGRKFWKPHRKPYDIMKEKLNCEYSEMIYIGDNIDKDFVTANKLGIKTICIKRKDGVYFDIINKKKEFYATMNINSLKELNTIIDGELIYNENSIFNSST